MSLACNFSSSNILLHSPLNFYFTFVIWPCKAAAISSRNYCRSILKSTDLNCFQLYRVSQEYSASFDLRQIVTKTGTTSGRCNLGSFIRAGQHLKESKYCTKGFSLLRSGFGESLVNTAHNAAPLCSERRLELQLAARGSAAPSPSGSTGSEEIWFDCLNVVDLFRNLSSCFF